MLAVVVADIEVEGEYQFERRPLGSNPEQCGMATGATGRGRLVDRGILEANLGSTGALLGTDLPKAGRCRLMTGALHLALALSNRGRRGRKRDFPDAERLMRRLVSQELVLSFVPDAEQRLWRTVMRGKYQLTRHHARPQNQLQALLEKVHTSPEADSGSRKLSKMVATDGSFVDLSKACVDPLLAKFC